MSIQNLCNDIASGASTAAVVVDALVIAMNALSAVFMATGLCTHVMHLGHGYVNNVASARGQKFNIMALEKLPRLISLHRSTVRLNSTWIS